MLSKSRCKALLTRMPRSYPTHEHAFFLCMIMGVKSNWDFAILRRVLYPFCFLTKIPGPYRTFLEAPILGWIRGPNGSDLPLTVRCQAWHDSNSFFVFWFLSRCLREIGGNLFSKRERKSLLNWLRRLVVTSGVLSNWRFSLKRQDEVSDGCRRVKCVI